MWEYNIFKNLHSFKIRSEFTRLSLAAPHTYDEFLYTEIRKWSDHKLASQSYCKQIEFADLDQENNCLYLLAFALVETVDELTAKFGQETSQWKLGRLQTTMFEHQPFSEVPLLGRIFSVTIPYPGNRRTVFQSYYPAHLQRTHVVKFTSVIRFYSDMGEVNEAGEPRIRASIDIGNEANIFSKHSRDFVDRFMAWEYEPFDWAQPKKQILSIN